MNKLKAAKVIPVFIKADKAVLRNLSHGFQDLVKYLKGEYAEDFI